jgi:hypothetical protein
MDRQSISGGADASHGRSVLRCTRLAAWGIQFPSHQAIASGPSHQRRFFMAAAIVSVPLIRLKRSRLEPAKVTLRQKSRPRLLTPRRGQARTGLRSKSRTGAAVRHRAHSTSVPPAHHYAIASFSRSTRMTASPEHAYLQAFFNAPKGNDFSPARNRGTRSRRA